MENSSLKFSSVASLVFSASVKFSDFSLVTCDIVDHLGNYGRLSENLEVVIGGGLHDSYIQALSVS